MTKVDDKKRKDDKKETAAIRQTKTSSPPPARAVTLTSEQVLKLSNQHAADGVSEALNVISEHMVVDEESKRKNEYDEKDAVKLSPFPTTTTKNISKNSTSAPATTADVDSKDNIATEEEPEKNENDTDRKPENVGSHRVAGFNARQRGHGQDEDSTSKSLIDGTFKSLEDSMFKSEKLQVTAVAVSREDLEEEVRKKVAEEAVPAIVIASGKGDDHNNGSSSSSSSRNRWYGILGAVLFIVVAITAVIGIATKSSSSSNLRGVPVPPGPETESGYEEASSEEDGYVYVLNMNMVPFCGHENIDGNFCGGHLASITNAREKALVDELKDAAFQHAKNLNLTLGGVWIGGSQIQGINDTGPEYNVTWGWSDDSAWSDNNGEWWADGEPNNVIDEFDWGVSGEHHVLLTSNGEFTDALGCRKHLQGAPPPGAPPPPPLPQEANGPIHAPGILILPSDYADNRNCRTYWFEEVIPVPPRGEKLRF